MSIHPLVRHPRSLVLLVALSLVSAAQAPMRAATLPSGFTESLVASGLASPTAMQFAPDGRLFVAEQGGRLRVIKDGALLPTPFLTLTVSSSGERGLLGVAFDPNFAVNRFVYVYYTATTAAVHNRISRFTANGDVAVAGSEVILLELDNLSSATNHNGGALAFGPDGKLYAAVGENANGSNAQSFGNLLGKMLRLNADGTIPSDNPFFGTASGVNRAIWALGLRNPFTFAFHPTRATMFINDVGQSTWEEINDGIAGANYGWPATEGATTDPRFVSPRYAYAHSGGACAITGGTFYAPPAPQFPADFTDDYFFADYCAGWIRKLDPAAGNAVTTFATGIASPVDLKVSDDGALYYLARGSGAVYRITYSAASPTITQHPVSRTVAPGTSVTFSVQATGPGTLRYQWQRNGIDIGGATSPSYTLVAATGDNGAQFRAVVSNDNGSVISNSATLTVTSNQPPAGTITQPAAGTLYSGGSAIAFAATASDPEDGTLPASAFTWRVDFHHDTHSHPFMPSTSGVTGGTFTIPTTGETSTNVWYRIVLTVRDSAGATDTTFRDVLPRKVNITLTTSPPGLQLLLDAQPTASPVTFESVVGIVRTLGAPSPQLLGGTSYEFRTWSDGGAATHTISTPPVDTAYLATYRVCRGSSRRCTPQ
jgi:glucose/arabinose dehydrogenase